MKKWREQAEVLQQKASEDEVLLNKIVDDRDISDSIFGFHAQQAIEKLLKAVLSLGKVEFKRTHNIRELMDLLADHGSPLPAHLHEIDLLTPYGVLARYETMPFTSSIDRSTRFTPNDSRRAGMGR